MSEGISGHGPGVPDGSEQGRHGQPPTLLESHLRELKEREENQETLRQACEALLEVHSKLWTCTRHVAPSKFQEWQPGEVHHQWVARLDVNQYATFWVGTAMVEAIRSIKAVECKLGISVAPILLQHIPSHFDRVLRHAGEFVRAQFERLYRSPDDADLLAQVTADIGSALAANRSAFDQYHWWLEFPAAALERVIRRFPSTVPANGLAGWLAEQWREPNTDHPPATPVRRRQGRQRSSDPDADRLVYERWESAGYTQYAELARDLGRETSAVKRAVDRHRHRTRNPAPRNK